MAPAVEPIERDSAVGVASGSAEESAIVVEHDFGFVRSGEKREHTYRITNTTDRTWTVQKVVNTCSCAVASVSESTVSPGADLDVSVVYSSGERAVNDRRRVMVVFREKGVAPVVLRVLARVRPPLTLTNSSIAFADVGRGQVRKRRIEVQNFDLSDWSDVRVRTTGEWLSCRVRRAGGAAHDENMRQRYLIEVTAHGPRAIQPRLHSRIVIEAIGENGEIVRQRSVPVTMTTTPAVSIVPRHLLFRDVRPGRDSVTTVTVTFSRDSIPTSLSDITFMHTLGSELKFDWESTRGRVWSLRAVLNCSTLPTREAKVHVAFADGRTAAIELPVYVFSAAVDQEVKGAAR